MLDQERHAAEGRASAKEDELLRFKVQLTTHQQQVFFLKIPLNQEKFILICENGIELGERVRITESQFTKRESRALYHRQSHE